MPMVKVAACQIDPQFGEVDRNLERIERWVVDAAQAGGGPPAGRRFKYRKMPLPFLGIDRFATPGPDAPWVVEVAGLRLGVLICYDLRFPEAARVCALEGADLIALPTNWPAGVNFHPGIFAPARAAENHCYLLAADRVGTERDVTFIGRSLLIDYDGNQMAMASDTDEEMIVGEIDPEAARATHVRRRPGEHEWDTMADRRPGLYERLLRPAVDRHPPDRQRSTNAARGARRY